MKDTNKNIDGRYAPLRITISLDDVWFTFLAQTFRKFLRINYICVVRDRKRKLKLKLKKKKQYSSNNLSKFVEACADFTRRSRSRLASLRHLCLNKKLKFIFKIKNFYFKTEKKFGKLD